MAGTSLPPRAYTKEILAQAFEWLKQQPISIRELATSADNLVSLYETALRRTQASRNSVFSDDSTNSPSTQAFKADLKNLAHDLKQFEDGSARPKPLSRPPVVETTVIRPALNEGFLGQLGQQLSSAQSATSLPAAPAAAVSAAASTATTATPPPPPTAPPTPSAPTPAVTSAASNPSLPPANERRSFVESLDRRTLEILQEVKVKLNLSSENEALRLLVTMGYDKVRDLLPR